MGGRAERVILARAIQPPQGARRAGSRRAGRGPRPGGRQASASAPPSGCSQQEVATVEQASKKIGRAATGQMGHRFTAALPRQRFQIDQHLGRRLARGLAVKPLGFRLWPTSAPPAAIKLTDVHQCAVAPDIKQESIRSRSKADLRVGAPGSPWCARHHPRSSASGAERGFEHQPGRRIIAWGVGCAWTAHSVKPARMLVNMLPWEKERCGHLMHFRLAVDPAAVLPAAARLPRTASWPRRCRS